jgi:hypothetical protein
MNESYCLKNLAIIPEQLQNPEFRFIKLKAKIPIEKKWQIKANYRYDDPSLLEWIQQGNNYGIVAGYGNLRIIDCDDTAFANEIRKKLPPTFEVKTGSGNSHFYIFCHYNKNHIFRDSLGEYRANFYQAVAPGSLHPETKKKYKVVHHHVPIYEIKKERLLEILQPYLRLQINKTTLTKNSIDTSRSGLEYRRIIALLRDGKRKAEIFSIMQAYSNWREAPEQYRQLTYQKALYYVGLSSRENNLYLNEVKKMEQEWETVERGIWKPAIYGDKIEGKYIEKKENLGPNKSNAYLLQTDEGVFLVWGTAILDDRMNAVNIGDFIRVTYKGTNKNGKGQNVKIFLVEKKRV